MAGKWLDLKGPVLADTLYCNGALAARDVTIALPEVAFVTAEFKAMGTLSLPINSMTENLEASVTKVGIDLGFKSMLALEPVALEARWAVDVRKSDGRSVTEGVKAFLRATPTVIPGISVEAGSPQENEMKFAVTRYQLIVDGEEYFLIDKLAGKLRINGVDYYDSVAKCL